MRVVYQPYKRPLSVSYFLAAMKKEGFEDATIEGFLKMKTKGVYRVLNRLTKRAYVYAFPGQDRTCLDILFSFCFCSSHTTCHNENTSYARNSCNEFCCIRDFSLS